jgi:hypothetical protein
VRRHEAPPSAGKRLGAVVDRPDGVVIFDALHRPVTVREGSTIGGQARSESERGAAVRSIGFPAPHRFRAAEKDIIGPENSKYT